MIRPTLPNAAIAVALFLLPCMLALPRTGPLQIALVVLAGVATLWVSQYQALGSRYLRHHKALKWALLIGASFLLSATLIGDLVHARWWCMDDHEVAVLLGPDGNIEFSEMITALWEHPEVGQMGQRTRVRPSYFVLRFTEAWLWGNDLRLWYGFRVFALGAIFVLCWAALWNWVGGIDAGLLMLLIFCWRMWADLWSRIGSSETYAMIGIALACFGVWLAERCVASRRLTNAIGWACIVLGTLIAIGCKENFLVLVPAVVAYTVWLYRRHRLGVTAILGTTLITGYGSLIAWTVVHSLADQGGVDIYANPRSLSTLAAATVRSLTMHLGVVMLALIATLFWAQRRLEHQTRYARLVPELRQAMWVVTGLLVLFVSQFAFYDGFSFLSNRYAFPAAIAPLLLIPMVSRIWLRYRRMRGDDRQGLRRVQFAMRMAVVLLVASMGMFMQRYARRHVDQTTAFTNEVLQVAQACTDDPSRPLLFVSHRPYDFELLYAVASYLKVYNVDNPMFLKLEAYTSEDTSNRLGKALSSRLHEASDRGDPTFAPLPKMAADCEPIQVGFGKEDPSIRWAAQFPCWR